MTEVWVQIDCSLCGERLQGVPAVEAHGKSCRPRRWHWWPRAHPYHFAALAWALGVVVGWLT